MRVPCTEPHGSSSCVCQGALHTHLTGKHVHTCPCSRYFKPRRHQVATWRIAWQVPRQHCDWAGWLPWRRTLSAVFPVGPLWLHLPPPSGWSLCSKPPPRQGDWGLGVQGTPATSLATPGHLLRARSLQSTCWPGRRPCGGNAPAWALS